MDENLQPISEESSLQAEAPKHEQRPWWTIWVFIAPPVLICLVFYIALLVSCPSVDHLLGTNPKTTALVQKRVRQGQLPKGFTLRSNWVKTASLPDMLLKTIVVAEDGAFYGHGGIDWHEVSEALRQYAGGKRLRGASTITQQLAKNLFLSNDRSFIRKLKEWVLAGRLESELSKPRILELYVNSIEFGKGVFGIGVASSRFFQKSPAGLSLDEMIRLAAVIPAPQRLNPNVADEELERRSRLILHRLSRFGYIDEGQRQRCEAVFNSFFASVTRD